MFEKIFRHFKRNKDTVKEERKVLKYTNEGKVLDIIEPIHEPEPDEELESVTETDTINNEDNIVVEDTVTENTNDDTDDTDGSVSVPETDNTTVRITKDYTPYNITSIEDGKFKYKNGRLSDYTVQDIKNAKAVINNYDDFPYIKSFNTILPYSNHIISRILWNIENGIFDEWIKEE